MSGYDRIGRGRARLRRMFLCLAPADSVPPCCQLRMPSVALSASNDRLSVGLMPVTDVFDRLMRESFSPVLKAAGFRRANKRSYVLTSANGDLVLVAPMLLAEVPSLRFEVEWAAIPRSLRAFHEERGGSSTPRLDWGLIYTRLEVPEEIRPHPLVSTEWMFADPDRIFDSGQALRFEEEIREKAIPLWRNALDREFLAGPYWRGSFELNLSWWDGPELRPLVLYIDDGDPNEMNRLLDLASSHTKDSDDRRQRLIEWLRERLTTRTARRR